LETHLQVAIIDVCPDFLVNTQVARLGLGVMAMTGCFAGVLFNLLFGFGLGLIRLTWIEYWSLLYSVTSREP
jgi:Ca2+/Na+ antiporter